MKEDAQEISGFRKMRVWQQGMHITHQTYSLTRLLPKEEMFGLVNQMRRSAVSIPSNIAEGSKRKTKNDFAQYLRIAHGSAAELETQLLIAEQEYGVETQDIIAEVVILQKMLTVLIKKL